MQFCDAKILIGIPYTNDIVPIDFCKSLMNLQKSNNTEILWMGHTITSAARNIIVQHAIREGYEYIFFIDSDMSLPNTTLHQLWSHNLDIVSGMYCVRRGNIETYIGHVWDEEKKVFRQVDRFDLSKQLNPIDAHGCGCLLIKTSVFEKIERPWFFYNDGHPKNLEYVSQAYFSELEEKIGEAGVTQDMLKHTGYSYGEDFNFFKKLKEIGIQAYVDTTIRCGHLGIFSRGETAIVPVKKQMDPIKI